MNTNAYHYRAGFARSALLALAMLAATMAVPAFAGNPDTCDLNNNVNSDEQDGGSSAAGLLAFACGLQTKPAAQRARRSASQIPLPATTAALSVKTISQVASAAALWAYST